jgi:hypothetical protein
MTSSAERSSFAVSGIWMSVRTESAVLGSMPLGV